MRIAWILASALVSATGAARAETPQPLAFSQAPMPAIHLPQVLVLGPGRDFTPAAQDRDILPVRPKGTVQTAVDHRFSERALGSLGYLCGLGEMANTSGGAGSAFEPMGTFLGGQFKLAF